MHVSKFVLDTVVINELQMQRTDAWTIYATGCKQIYTADLIPS
jgi:hypothetical protein